MTELNSDVMEGGSTMTAAETPRSKMGKKVVDMDHVPKSLSDEEFQAECPEHFRSICPDICGLAMLIATHPMMHAGQFVPVRRALGKPVVI